MNAGPKMNFKNMINRSLEAQLFNNSMTKLVVRALVIQETPELEFEPRGLITICHFHGGLIQRRDCSKGVKIKHQNSLTFSLTFK